MVFNLDEKMYFIEGALFSSGKPLSVDELSKKLGIDKKGIRKGLRKLMSLYRNRKSALKISKVGKKYGMMIKQEYDSVTQDFTPTSIPNERLQVLALIAYKQPVKQSHMVKLLGYKIYNHVKELRKMNLIYRNKEGLTYTLSTTKKFCERFGIPSTKTEDVREWVKKQFSKYYEEIYSKKGAEVNDEGSNNEMEE